MKRRSILVIAEFVEGQPRVLSLEAIHAARRLADGLDAEVVVAAAGSAVKSMADCCAQLEGVDRVVTFESDDLEPFLPGVWTAAVTSMVQHVEPVAVMIPSSITGRDYAARVAARLDAGLVPDVTGVNVDDGRIVAVRSVLGGRVQTAVTFEPDPAAMMTIAAGAFPRAGSRMTAAPVETAELTIDAVDRRAVILDTTVHEAGGKALGAADRIVTGGRGLGKAEHFSLIEELARELDAAVGASGAVVGAGWRSHADQVGSTGHTVAPKLYLAVGVSGAPQHLVGMQGSDYVVAINRDPDAPIFKVAAFGIVGDLFEVVPAVIDELRAQRSP
jgi:electron transfer flavoprotein alpha subunit